MNKIIGIIGLGYVGLPLAIEFGTKLPTIGFDIDKNRIFQLSQFQDKTLEISEQSLKNATFLTVTELKEDLAKAQIFIVTVPTPIDKANRPDLNPLISATNTVGGALKKGDIVIYESTVYPGCTEEVCVPVLEKISGLKFNVDFFCGYSPERMI